MYTSIHITQKMVGNTEFCINYKNDIFCNRLTGVDELLFYLRMPLNCRMNFGKTANSEILLNRLELPLAFLLLSKDSNIKQLSFLAVV